MNDRIDLTHEEEMSAVAAISALIGGVALHRIQPQQDTLAATIIDQVLKAINGARYGDPSLTIRRQPNRGRVAIRCEPENGPGGFWVEVDVHGNCRRVNSYSSARAIETEYPIVYSPEA